MFEVLCKTCIFSYRPARFLCVVRANLFGNAQAVHSGMEKLSIAYQTPEGKEAGMKLFSAPTDGNLDPSEFPTYLRCFSDMWADGGVQEAVRRANELQLNDSSEYFWNRANVILQIDYIPSDDDVLRARVRTTGIVQQNFNIEEQKYTVFDVGGQRNERRKWIHCFDNVTAVIFVTAISEFDQTLYEDENTNRMEEALLLFDQICNHPSFKKTSMILFFNKRDLFLEKLATKDLTCWDPLAASAGQDYNACLKFIKQRFIEKNRDPEGRQVYTHATCATDTSNISFVMESVLDIILKENLRKMDAVNIDRLISTAGNGKSTVKSPASWTDNTVLLCSCFFTDLWTDRSVLTAADIAQVPAVELMPGRIKQDSPEWEWLMSLGKEVPELADSAEERGSFQGNFKEGANALRLMLGVPELGFVYDEPIYLAASGITLICCVRSLPSKGTFTLPSGCKWVSHENFEDAHYPKYAGITKANPKPDHSVEFNPFAPNPVGHRWLRAVTLFTAQTQRLPKKGVYLGVFKFVSTLGGFKVMVNEHNRTMVPLVYISERQLSADEKRWMHGVRARQLKGIDLLEGAQPNRSWLGPEMSGEEGASFPQKLWWAIDEAKHRLSADNIGEFYDSEILDIDEENSLQLLLFGCLAKDENDILPGHIWVDRRFLEVQNMKHLCPRVLKALKAEVAQLLGQYHACNLSSGGDMEAVMSMRRERDKLKAEIEAAIKAQYPLKWVNRVIMWCADKMPSFVQKVETHDSLSIDDLVSAALEINEPIEANSAKRRALIAKYLKQ